MLVENFCFSCIRILAVADIFQQMDGILVKGHPSTSKTRTKNIFKYILLIAVVQLELI